MARNPLVLRFHEPKRAEAIIELIRDKAVPQFTHIVSSKDTPVSESEVVFLALTPDRVDYLACVEGGAMHATFQRRIMLFDFVAMDLAIDEWANMLPKAKQARLVTLLQAGGRFTDALWRDARQALFKAHPRLRRAFKQHQNKSYAAEKVIDAHEVESPILEREALACALEIWGGSRARQEALNKASPITDRAPFLQNLDKVDLRETIAIEHDSSNIPGYERLRPYLVGAVEFINQGTKLTVLNANLKPLEHVLGVDLVYYNHVFRSFVLIQYKRMADTVKERPCYRPDSDENFTRECNRMDKWIAAFKSLPKQPVGYREFRLGTGPFFFKFCDLRAASAFDTSLAPGFYLPYLLMRRLLKSKVSQGPRGGRVIGWETGHRYLSNKRMMELIQAGWVGSSGSVTTVLNDVLGSILTGNRSLIYAVSAPLRGGSWVHRDPMGRYAAESDPLARPEIQ